MIIYFQKNEFEKEYIILNASNSSNFENILDNSAYDQYKSFDVIDKNTNLNENKNSTI